MMNVAITKPEIEKIVQERVKRGEYASAEEVVAAALLHFDEECDDDLTEEQVNALRKELRPAIEQADRGEFVEFTAEDIIREEMKKLASGKKK